jgi:hypothetical protein
MGLHVFAPGLRVSGTVAAVPRHRDWQAIKMPVPPGPCLGSTSASLSRGDNDQALPGRPLHGDNIQATWPPTAQAAGPLQLGDQSPSHRWHGPAVTRS